LVINDFDKYLKAATRYQVYAFIKKNKTVAIEYRETLPERIEGYEINAAAEKIAYQELEGQLIYHLRLVPERCREIFFLSRVQQLNNSEIAEKLGISKRTVENQITRALQCIRFNMKDIVFSLLLLWEMIYSRR
jgi:RNA polymerase sigma-70 factor (ECF subfamily)